MGTQVAANVTSRISGPKGQWRVDLVRERALEGNREHQADWLWRRLRLRGNVTYLRGAL